MTCCAIRLTSLRNFIFLLCFGDGCRDPVHRHKGGGQGMISLERCVPNCAVRVAGSHESRMKSLSPMCAFILVCKHLSRSSKKLKESELSATNLSGDPLQIFGLWKPLAGELDLSLNGWPQASKLAISRSKASSVTTLPAKHRSAVQEVLLIVPESSGFTDWLRKRRRLLLLWPLASARVSWVCDLASRSLRWPKHPSPTCSLKIAFCSPGSPNL